MMSAKIELPIPVTRQSVEWAYRRARIAQERRDNLLPAQARRAAKAQDPKLLLALDKGSEILRKMSEEQAGPHGFDVGGRRVPHTEFQMWKNAYTLVDGGKADDAREVQVYEWILLAAAILAGIVY